MFKLKKEDVIVIMNDTMNEVRINLEDNTATIYATSEEKLEAGFHNLKLREIIEE